MVFGWSKNKNLDILYISIIELCSVIIIISGVIHWIKYMYLISSGGCKKFKLYAYFKEYFCFTDFLIHHNVNRLPHALHSFCSLFCPNWSFQKIDIPQNIFVLDLSEALLSSSYQNKVLFNLRVHGCVGRSYL